MILPAAFPCWLTRGCHPPRARAPLPSYPPKYSWSLTSLPGVQRDPKVTPGDESRDSGGALGPRGTGATCVDLRDAGAVAGGVGDDVNHSVPPSRLTCRNSHDPNPYPSHVHDKGQRTLTRPYMPPRQARSGSSLPDRYQVRSSGET